MIIIIKTKMENLNIAHLIEKNSITRLSKNYENKFLMKIKENFNDNQQQLFVASFYCFLNYDKKNDFVIDFDNVWKWLGFTRKDSAKKLLEKFFTIEIDYKTVFRQQAENLNGGRPKENIMLNVNTFKKFCLKADTKKADEVHDYYIKLEELLQETLNEETTELKLQLQNKEEENKKLLKKYVKKQKDITDQQNVVYLMATEESEKIGEYVIGKSVDLDNRKEEYDHNKLHDFKIVYYRSCATTKIMDIVEAAVLMKLGKYRCKAGRDVFLLPDTTDVSLFTNMFDECLKFYENVEFVIYPKRTIEKENKEKQKDRHDKYREENKDKIKLQQKEYREDNKEIISEVKKEYYQKNVEVIGEKNKKYYEENKENIIEQALQYYKENKEAILDTRKEFYQDNKDSILEERAIYYQENYETKIAVQRQKKETCECGMIISHYCMKKHKNSTRHIELMKKMETPVVVDENKTNKATCECGITISIKSMKKHQNSKRHTELLKKINEIEE